MLTDPITSEHPEEHWKELVSDMYGDRVLDLGCGFGREGDACDVNDWSTSLTFARHDASLVVGIDANLSDLDRLTEMATQQGYFSRIVYLPITIASNLDAYALLWYVRPHIVKCDIEGAERYLFDTTLPPETWLVSIECHDAELEATCLKWLAEQGFEITANRPLAAHPTIKVVTGRRTC